MLIDAMPDISIDDDEIERIRLLMGLPALEKPKLPGSRTARHSAKPVAATAGLTVQLSVRRKFQTLESFTYTSKTIFREIALREARQAAEAEGLEVWGILDVYTAS